MKKTIIIVISLLLSLILIAVVWEFVYVKTATEKEVYIFPKNFKGIVLIAYDQKLGIKAPKKDGKFIYKIPTNGVLKLKRKFAPTLTKTWYYFEDEQGNKTEFYYCFDETVTTKNPNKVFAFGKSNGGFENNGQKVKTITFWVGSEKDRDSLSELNEKLNPLDLIK